MSATILNVLRQIGLLLFKRKCEILAQRWLIVKIFFPLICVFSLLLLLYDQIPFFFPGGIEQFLVVIGFWIFIQQLVVVILVEKDTKLQESLRMMGMLDVSYWTSYFISDGLCIGFILALLSTIFSTGGLFNDANVGIILILTFVFCLASIPFSIFITTLVDTPQTGSQFVLGVLFTCYVIYIACNVDTANSGIQTLAALVPPLGLQIATGSFKKSYKGISAGSIIGLLFFDIFLWSILAWYSQQVMPSKHGIRKPWYFIFNPIINQLYPPAASSATITASVAAINNSLFNNVEESVHDSIQTEEVNEDIIGKPSVMLKNLTKSYEGTVVVNKLSLSMYENQIFCLLGHNGAGKSTTIGILTGLTGADSSTSSQSAGATIYGNSISTDMDSIRKSMGVCPQHDCLFDHLTVQQHIVFFAQLKGSSYDDAVAESTNLMKLFDMSDRLNHLGHMLSGGQKRKLSVSIATCSNTKFIVLDEPTAGMDPLARRQMWDLILSLRKDRTILLTTHYMDEADVLGDRIAIISLGQLKCIGSPAYLKLKYGHGYNLILDMTEKISSDALNSLTGFVKQYIGDASYIDSSHNDGSYQVVYNLPYTHVKSFGSFFTALEKSKEKLHIRNVGINATSLEDVFLSVGEDHSVKAVADDQYGIGSAHAHNSTSTGDASSAFISQTTAIIYRRLHIAMNDYYTTVPLIMLPMAAAIVAASIYKLQIISKENIWNNLVSASIIMIGYLGAPGIIAEFQVRERADRLRNVLTVMGCDFRCYWLGSFVSDFIILLPVVFATYISWGAADMTDYTDILDDDANSRVGTSPGLPFFILPLFVCYLIAYSYAFSFLFNSPGFCLVFMPIVTLLLILAPTIFILIISVIVTSAGGTFSTSGGPELYGITVTSPLGALFGALIDATSNIHNKTDNFPPTGFILGFMILETVVYMLFAYYVDFSVVRPIFELPVDVSFNESVLDSLDEDVKAERAEVMTIMSNTDPSVAKPSLVINRIRKLFPSKVNRSRNVVAVEDVSFSVSRGNIFGLLGANGAGKTTILACLMRHLIPTSGDASLCGHSILTDFTKGSTKLGVVTQNNSLWHYLSVQDHLFLFARLRGVQESKVTLLVESTMNQLQLTKHRHKQARALSGGMQRKLCCAISLIGDPEVVLLDEISAGLDPVSRRHLWNVLLSTMGNRAVVLTTHSMEEAEVLCQRIGIMVKGQLRALGSKQHLKQKFGSGYELVIKMNVKATNIDDFNVQLSTLGTYVTTTFPSAKAIAHNGGLVTYEIPSSEMQIGHAFDVLESNKVRYGIEEYIISQPSLEQVFIKTVLKNSQEEANVNPLLSNLLLIEGSRKSLSASIDGGDVLRIEADASQVVAAEKNKCGLTRNEVIYSAIFTAAVFALMVVLVFTLGRHGSPAINIIAILALIASITCCSCVCCPCCVYPKEQES